MSYAKCQPESITKLQQYFMVVVNRLKWDRLCSKGKKKLVLRQRKMKITSFSDIAIPETIKL